MLVIIPTWFICPKTDTHSSNSHLIATRPEVKSTNSRSQVKRPNRYITTPLNELISYVNSSKNNLFNWIIVDVSATAAAFFGTTVHGNLRNLLSFQPINLFKDICIYVLCILFAVYGPMK